MKATAGARELLLELKRAHWLPPYAVRLLPVALNPSRFSPCPVAQHTHAPGKRSERPRQHQPADGVAAGGRSCIARAQADGVRGVVETMIAMFDESKNLQKLSGVDLNTPEDSAAPIVRMLTMLRNRDMLLCYLRHRMDRIEQARWDVAGFLPEDALEVLSPNEREYDRQYAALLSEYQSAYDLDLTRDSKPPSELYIKVPHAPSGSPHPARPIRLAVAACPGGSPAPLPPPPARAPRATGRHANPPALPPLPPQVLAKEEIGAFVGAESGATIDPMKAGDTVFLRRGDVEPLVRQGKLEHVDF